jgi:XTP/dITP diphosphohydrolase
MNKIVFASSNNGKISEVRKILSSNHLEIITQSEFNIPDAKETGLSFIENAILKARHCARYSKMPSFADDSGLEVDALQGKPGIYSARFSGENGDNKKNITKLLGLLKDTATAKRTARFQCHIALIRHEFDPTPIIVSGVWEGLILDKEKGNDGFGYDPVFYLPSLRKTAAELTDVEKNSISHRSLALNMLKQKIREVRI